MMIKITPVPNKIKFSHSVSRGSDIERGCRTKNIINKVYNEIASLGYPDNISVNNLKKIIIKVLPEKKRIDIIDLIDKKSYGGEDFLSESSKLGFNEKYIGYKIDLPLSDKSLSILNLPVFIHEFTHVLDSLFKPKYSSRLIKCEDMVCNIYSHCDNIRPFSTKYNECYKNSLYKEEKFSTVEEIPAIINKRRQEVLKLLKNRKPFERIIILQNYRYYLQSELLAYSNEKMIFGRLIEDNLEFDKECFDAADYSQYLFREKIQMLRELCFEEIQKQRESFKK